MKTISYFATLALLITFVACAEDKSLERPIVENTPTIMHKAGIPPDACRTLNFTLYPNEGCGGTCTDCAKYDVVVTPSERAFMENQLLNVSASVIAAYFSSEHWKTVFPELDEEKWSNELDILISGGCVSVTKDILETVTVYSFRDADNKVIFAQPILND